MKRSIAGLLCLTAISQGSSLEQLWMDLDAHNNGLKSLDAKVEKISEQHKAATAAFLPSIKLEAIAQHLNDDLVMDLSPIRDAMIQLQSNNSAQTATLSAVMKNPAMTAEQQQAYLQQAQQKANQTLQQQLPPFRSTLKDQDHWTAALVAVQPLYTGGRLWYGREAMEQMGQAARQERAKALADLKRESGKLWIQSLLLQESLALRFAALDVYREHQKRADALVSQGFAEPKASLQAATALIEAEASIDEDSAKAMAISAVLQELSGQEQQTQEQLPTPESLQNAIGEWSTQAQTTPAVALAQTQVKLAESADRVRLGDLQPEVAAFARYELHPEALSAMEPEWVVGVKATIPLKISDWYQRQASKAQQREAEYGLKYAQGQVTSQIQRSRRLAQASLKKWKAFGTREQLALEQQQLAKKRWEAAQIPYVEVVEADIALHKARLDRAQSAAETWINALELASSTGQESAWLRLWQERRP